MKYVISDRGEVETGYGFHADLAEDFKGTVVAAGHFCIEDDGSVRVFGRSMGYGIESKTEDAEVLERAIATHV